MVIADNITLLKCLILQHLPVLVHAENPSPAITSIYLDDPDFSLYHERMSKSEGAQTIRIRHYGPEPTPSSTIYVERKTHHEDWTGLESVKARFGIKEKHAQHVLAGTFDVEKGFKKWKKSAMEKGDEKGIKEVEKAETLAREVQETIRKRNLQPMIRTFYNRTAFQIPGNANVRISLDTDLHMVREDNEGCDRRRGGWMRPDCGIVAPLGGGKLKPEDVCVFPYAILEVKIQTHEGVEAPEWIQRLVESNLVSGDVLSLCKIAALLTLSLSKCYKVEAVPKFSKFGHGVATLRSENISLLPYWLVQMENDIRGPTPGYEASKSIQGNAPAPYLPPIPTDQCADLKGGVDSVVVTYTSNNGKNKPDRHSETSTPSNKGSDSSHTIIVVDPYATNQDKILVDDVPAKQKEDSRGSWWRRGPSAGSSSSLPNKNYWKKDKRIAVPVRIDPKLYMQNERTFLQWMKCGCLVIFWQRLSRNGILTFYTFSSSS